MKARNANKAHARNEQGSKSLCNSVNRYPPVWNGEELLKFVSDNPQAEHECCKKCLAAARLQAEEIL